MPGPRINQPLYILLVITFLFNLLPWQLPARTYAAAQSPSISTPANSVPAQPAALPASKEITTAINFATGYYKVQINNADQTAINNAAKSGGFLLADYGAFSLWKLPNPTGPAKNSSVQPDAEFDRIGLRDGAVDTSQPVTPPAAGPTPSKNGVGASAQQLWMVQFIGPIKPEWLEKLQKLGVELVIYMPNNTYVIWATDSQIEEINKQVSSGNTKLQWAGPYKPEYRLEPGLKAGKNSLSKNLVKVTVQFYTTAKVQDSLAKLQKLGGGAIIQTPFQVLKFTDITMEVPASEVENISQWPDVFNVEQWADRVKRDEAQGQILAGNITSSGGKIVPTGPGYLAWLTSKGFPTTASAYPIVDVVDDGVDNGTTTPVHPDFYTFGNPANASRLVSTTNCTDDPLADGQDGHGNLNTGIVGGYNNMAGQPYTDSNGFNRGLGISPFGRLAETKIFENSAGYNISQCGNNDAGVVLKSYQKGAALTTNSWGSDVFGRYDATSQAYDQLTRDAAGSVAGNQQMLHVFSAGNRGTSATTIGSPGTAKNVLTVGATENVRDNGVLDGCSLSASDNADDIASYSSRGPTTDGRTKPDIVAPGTHIQGPASQPIFNGNGVCGGSPASGSDYYPNPSQPPGQTSSQTLYTWSSGTSHSTPAVAGGMSLLYNYYARVLAPSQAPTRTLATTPSPAMAKAVMLNATRYLNGSGSGDTLPSPNQGWGDLNLGTIFDNVPRRLVDQSVVFTGTGQEFNQLSTVNDTSKPIRITLAWTDAPGSTTGNSYVNNLNLQVMLNGQVYKGNVFSGGFSTTGGSFDDKNNVESVFLPVGVSGNFTVTVIATNLAGDGIPGNASATDQDFALVVYNAVEIPPKPSLKFSSNAFSGGDGDNIVEPGETLNLQVSLLNAGDATATNITGQLTSSSPGIMINNGSSAYANIAAGATATNTTPFNFTVGQYVPYGSVITFTEQVNYNNGLSGQFVFALQVGTVALQQTGVQLGEGDTDPYAEPGESVRLKLGLTNAGTADANNVMGVLTTSDPNVTINAGTSTYGKIAGGATVTNTTTPYYITLAPGADCNTAITFTHTVTYSPDNSQVFTFTVQPGAPQIAASANSYPATDVPQNISTVGTPTITSTIPITTNGLVGKIRATVNISHTYDGDLTIALVGPDGTRVNLANRRGSMGDNYTNTTFDDAASTSIAAGTAPFTGTFKPDASLTTFIGKSFNGDWKLEVVDNNNDDGGSLNSWTLEIFPVTYTCNAPPHGNVTPKAGDSQSTQVSTNFATTLAVTVTNGSGNPVSGKLVAFQVYTATNGASGNFGGNPSVTATTNSSGTATAPSPLTANGIEGTFTVVASVTGNFQPAVFHLVNFGDCDYTEITEITDNGSGNTCGSLSYAFKQLANSPGITLTFALESGRTITVSGPGFDTYSLPRGVNLDGEDCTDPIILNGAGTAAGTVGLTLNKSNIKALIVTAFPGKQIVANNGGNKFTCIKAFKT